MVKFRTLDIGSRPDANGSRVCGMASSKTAGLALLAGSRLPDAPGDRAKKGISDQIKLTLYEKATFYLGKVFNDVKDGQTPDLDEGFGIMRDIVDTQTPQDALFLKAIHSDESYRFILHHSVNVAIYAVKLAESLGYNRDRQIEVGMAGLLHEVGMAMIPDELIFKTDLNERDFHVFKERPVNGYNILRSVKGPHAYLAECALQVYERIDGSGYPKGLKGDEIHEYAQLIGLVDMYEALVHTRPQREKFLHYNAVKEIINKGKKCFQPRHIKALLTLFSVFPLHSYVKLNSNAIGKVINTYPDQPMRPKLQMVMDSQRNMILSERVLNLPENPLLYITEALSEEDLVAYSEGSYFRDRSLSGPSSTGNGDGTQDPDDDPETVVPVPSRRSFWQRFGSRALSYGGAAAALILVGFWLSGQTVDSSQGDAASAPMPLTSVGDPVPPAEEPSSEQVPADPEAKTQTPSTIADLEEETIIAAISTQVSDTNHALAELAAAPAIVGDEPALEPLPFEPEQDLADPGDSQAPSYPFSLLLGSFNDVEQARQTAAVYERNGLASYWVKVDLGADGIRYRVFGGHFASADAAGDAAVKQRLSPLAVKATRYAVQIGSPSDRQGADAVADLLYRKGFSPYRVAVGENTHIVYLGAFYTEKGARDQLAELQSLPVKTRVVER